MLFGWSDGVAMRDGRNLAQGGHVWPHPVVLPSGGDHSQTSGRGEEAMIEMERSRRGGDVDATSCSVRMQWSVAM